MTPPGIALQLWTVRERYDAAPDEVLARVAEMGYPAVETVYSRPGGRSHAEQREALDRYGLAAPSMHAFIDELEDDLDGVLAAARTQGAAYVVCAWVGPERRQSPADYQDLARSLTSIGKRCRDEGLQLCYHHHDFELADAGGRRGMEWIWEGVDAELLKAEVDVYWVDVAGIDGVAYLEALGERCALLHCKDRARPGTPPLAEPDEGLASENAEVGAGVLDFPALLAAASHARWLIAEQDFSAGDPLDSAQASLHALRRLLALEAPA